VLGATPTLADGPTKTLVIFVRSSCESVAYQIPVKRFKFLSLWANSMKCVWEQSERGSKPR